MYKPGDHLCICDRCGFRHYTNEMKIEWNGSFVCLDCWEPKHEQFVEPTGRHEKQTVAISRPEGDPIYIDTSVRPGDVIL